MFLAVFFLSLVLLPNIFGQKEFDFINQFNSVGAGQFPLDSSVILYRGFADIKKGRGSRVTLRELLKDRPETVLINFWATWCGYCRDNFPKMLEAQKKFPADKLKILPILLL